MNPEQEKALKELEETMEITNEAIEIGKRKLNNTATPEDFMRLLEIQSWVESKINEYEK